MKTTPLNCLRCSDVMEIGFIVDHGMDGNGIANWHPGPVRTKPPGVGGIEAVLVHSKQKPITAYRCPKCGTLELVAR